LEDRFFTIERQGIIPVQPLGLNEIRSKFLDFFESKDHLILPSASLVPKNDPSVLLINAGMTPFKPYFSGAAIPPSRRIATCQKCIRTPDIERVGETARHGTFFEMLGNFSFADYFKKEAIVWAWEFCLDVLGMPEEKLTVSIYEDDDEAFYIWRDEIGLDESKIYRLGKEDNFWEHGIGPCGPCSEIFFDRGEEHGCGRVTCQTGCDCDRFVEFWNLVFTQFNKEEDGTYSELSTKNIDTGAGLERVAAIMQDVDNLFEVDTIRSILDHICRLADKTYGEDEEHDVAIRVITDHIRSSVMMLADGIVPGNEGRGYVLRRLIRRAARFGRLLGIPAPFLTTLVPTVIEMSKEAYPELAERKERILLLLGREEDRFNETISQGLSILDSFIEEGIAAGTKIITGDRAFLLHDTYGFPLDLTREIASEFDFEVDLAAFDAAMAQQKEKARQALREKVGSAWDGHVLPESLDRSQPTVFTGYDTCTDESVITALLLLDGEQIESVDTLSQGEHGLLLTEKTPFYAESGGQIGDTGVISAESAELTVEDTTKTEEGLFLHHVVVERGQVDLGEAVTLTVDEARRKATARNHTATHLLHSVLRNVLGDHVEQAGSEVSPEQLRFDFSHFGPVTPEEKAAIERGVNEAILADYPVVTEIMTLEEARASDATALFDEKYDDEVRVLSIGDFSKELCGGTHLTHSSQAGFFRITGEGGIASGVRRIVAVTGEAAIRDADEDRELIETIGEKLKSDRDDVLNKVVRFLAERKEIRQKLEELGRDRLRSFAESVAAKAEKIGDLKLVMAVTDAEDTKQLRETGDRIRDLAGDSVVVLAAKNDDKLLWLGMASKEAVKLGAHVGTLIKAAAEATGGRGGGRADMAQAGGKSGHDLNKVFEQIKKQLSSQLEVNSDE
jgi:alanyl-tRNA synthetase